MKNIFIYLRIAAAIILLLYTTALMVPIYYSGLRYKGIRLSSWLIQPHLRLLNKVWQVTVRCDNPEKLRAHQGLIFANHQSYLDITTLYTVAPTRSLAAIEVLERPVIGWMSKAVGCLFVDRGNIKSAVTVRDELADVMRAEPHPPIIMYPEGKLGSADALNKFRRGSFRIAIENELPYLLCAIRYDNPEVTTWHGGAGESMLGAILRLFQHRQPITAKIFVLDTITPTPMDSPQELAVQAREIIGSALGLKIE